MKDGSITFNYPEWLLLLPLLLIISLVLRQKAKHTKSLLGPSSLALVSGVSASRLLHPLIHLLPKSYSTASYPISQNIIYALIISCLVVALAEPVRIGERLPDPPQERDIVFIVDTSVSMILRDYVLDGQRVDRMSLIKELLDRFIQKLEGHERSRATALYASMVPIGSGMSPEAATLPAVGCCTRMMVCTVLLLASIVASVRTSAPRQ